MLSAADFVEFIRSRRPAARGREHLWLLVVFVLTLTFAVLGLVFAAIDVLQDRHQAHVIERNVLRANEKVNDFLRTRDVAAAEGARAALLAADSLLHAGLEGQGAAVAGEILVGGGAILQGQLAGVLAQAVVDGDGGGGRDDGAGLRAGRAFGIL